MEISILFLNNKKQDCLKPLIWFDWLSVSHRENWDQWQNIMGVSGAGVIIMFLCRIAKVVDPFVSHWLKSIFPQCFTYSSSAFYCCVLSDDGPSIHPAICPPITNLLKSMKINYNPWNSTEINENLCNQVTRTHHCPSQPYLQREIINKNIFHVVFFLTHKKDKSETRQSYPMMCPRIFTDFYWFVSIFIEFHEFSSIFSELIMDPRTDGWTDRYRLLWKMRDAK